MPAYLAGMADTASDTTADPGHRPTTHLRTAIIALAVISFCVAYPGLAWAAARFAAQQLAAIAPILLLALLLTSAATASGAAASVTAAFRGRELPMIALASFVGALTPVCGITVLPFIAGLLAAGVPLAPVMAFWLSSPTTDPAMLTVTAATLGLPFAIGKSLAAFGCGLVGGAATLAMVRLGRLGEVAKPASLARFAAGACGGGDAVRWRFWLEPARLRVFRDSAIAAGRLMTVWLFAAFVAEFFLRRYLPQDLVISLVGTDNAFAVPLAATVGAPIYLDGYAALPLIRGLMDTGMAPGAAMAFLIAGGIISIYGAVPVYALVRFPVFVFYLALAVACSMLAGWGYGLFAP